jgi:6-phosphogluconolactonase
MRAQRSRIYITFVAVLLCGSVLSNSNSPQTRDEANSSGGSYAYVSLDSAQCIAIYRVDPANGELRLVKKVNAGGMPGSLAVDPTNSFLYAAIRSSNSISSFRINPTDGDLALIGTIRAAGNPVFLKTDKTGKFLLSAYFADSKAAVYRIGPDGGAQDSAVVVWTTEKNAHSIQIDPTNRYLFIPCRTGETIHQYKFDQVLGTLTPNEPDRVITPPNTGPRHFTFHRKLQVVYFVNEFGNSVTAFRLDSSYGTLEALQTLSTLPQDFVGQSAAADVHLTPDGRFLYASNRGHESIAAFSVDTLSGHLTQIGHFATEKTPRSFAIDHSGRFLYSGGQGSGRIAAYRIDAKSGNLGQFETYDAGKNPVWILTVKVDQQN